MEQHWFWVLCTLVVSAAAQSITFPANIEIDIFFPRNETYAPVAPFPIVFAIQNAAAAWNFGFHLNWELRSGTTSMSGLDDFGFFSVTSITGPELPPADPYIFLNTTSSPSIYAISSGDLQTWTLTWTFGFYANCTDHGDTYEIESVDHNVGGSIEFSTEAGGILPDVVAASESSNGCALLGGLVQMQANLTGCPHIGDTGIPGNPCAVDPRAVSSQIQDDIVPTTTGGVKATSTASSTTAGQATGASTGTTTGTSSEPTQSTNAAAHGRKDAIFVLGIIAALAIAV